MRRIVLTDDTGRDKPCPYDFNLLLLINASLYESLRQDGDV